MTFLILIIAKKALQICGSKIDVDSEYQNLRKSIYCIYFRTIIRAISNCYFF